MIQILPHVNMRWCGDENNIMLMCRKMCIRVQTLAHKPWAHQHIEKRAYASMIFVCTGNHFVGIFSVHHFMLNGSTQQQHSKPFFSSRKRQRSSKTIAQERAVTTDKYTHTKRSEEKDEKKNHQNTKNRLTQEEVKNTRRTARGLKRFSSNMFFLFIHFDGMCEWMRVFLYRAIKAGEGTNRISEQATISFQSKKQDDHSLSCWFIFFLCTISLIWYVLSRQYCHLYECVFVHCSCVFFFFVFCWCFALLLMFTLSVCMCSIFFFHSSVCFNCNWCFYSILAACVCMRVGHSDHN